MFLLVGLSGFHAPTGRRIRTVHMSKEPSRPQNKPSCAYFQIRKGGGGQKLPLQIQIPLKYLQF